MVVEQVAVVVLGARSDLISRFNVQPADLTMTIAYRATACHEVICVELGREWFVIHWHSWRREGVQHGGLLG